MVETDSGGPVISLQELIDWHTEEAAKLDAIRAGVNRSSKLMEDDQSPDAQFALGKVFGMGEILNGVRAFVIARSNEYGESAT